MKQLIKGLIDCKVTEVIAGGSNGSIILLELGSRFLLYVYCTWRLELRQKILTGWNDSNDPISGQLTLEIKKLRDDRIKHISMTDFYDLEMTFLSKKVLKVFCDITSHASSEALNENWCLCDKEDNRCLIVNSDQKILERPYESDGHE